MSMLVAAEASAGRARLKDLTQVQGVRDNELYGYGLVTGLSGTGDSERVFFTSQSISGMLGRLGIRVDARDVRSRNVAAVMVTARLPTYSRSGSRLDVTVSSIGNAHSLAGGVLLFTPLMAADGQVYAVAQGSVQVGGFEAVALGTSVKKNPTTSGRVPSGGVVEQTFAPKLAAGPIVLGLKHPDLSTAVRIASAVEQKLGAGSARAVDPAALEVTAPEQFKDTPLVMLASLETLEIDVDERARVVINERTGTVVAGENVRLRPAAVAHGGLQVTVATRTAVSQPPAFSGGSTVVTPYGEASAAEQKAGAVALPATASVDDLVKALNALGVTPRDLVSILQALHAAGSLEADLEVL
ncbi:MAG: flagellar basal body P-ring protein FlgI [Myxococcaceae bacterium]|nr:flagellar basal body P-ring protein FlgI [Myxococcaceae bacterium]